MAIIDVASWKPQTSEFVFAYRYPQTNLSTYTQLIVYESQEALLFTKGKLMGKFGPGKHTLDTENLPVLRSLFGIPFGGKNPYTAEVWIVNKVMATNLKMRVDRMAIHDTDYQTQLPLVAIGQYGLKVIDSEKFLINLVGTKDVFSESDMHSQAYGEFATKVKSAIMQFMLTNHVGYKQISAFLDQISTYVKENIKQFWGDYGLEMTKFYITAIDIDDSTPEGQKVKSAIATQTSMSITGHTWQQEQAFDMANSMVDQIGNFGGGGGTGGLLGGLMAINMMNNVQGQMGGGMMQANFNQPTFGGNQNGGMQQAQQQGGRQQPRMVYCATCSQKHMTTERFCPHCGAEYNPCPKCGSDNLKSAKRCISCGTPLSQGNSGAVCPNCGAMMTPGAAFCSQCGASAQVAQGHNCPRCGSSVGASQRFCPTCGYKFQ